MTPLPARARRQADKLRDFALELEIPNDTASNIYAAEMRRAEQLLGKALMCRSSNASSRGSLV